MSFYALKPEVPGTLGQRSELIQCPGTYPIVRRLHFEFSYGTLGNDLITSHPAFLVTEALADPLEQSGLSGFAISSDVDVTVDEQVWLFEPNWQPPAVRWLKVAGEPASDDFGLTADAQLVVSSRALLVLRQFKIDDCEVIAIAGDIPGP
jgi:hypothetical protein